MTAMTAEGLYSGETSTDISETEVPKGQEKSKLSGKRTERAEKLLLTYNDANKWRPENLILVSF